MRASWKPLVDAFLERSVVRGVVLLIDIRRGAESEERDVLDVLAAQGVAAAVVLTKVDKASKAQRKPAALALQRELELSRPPIQCSAHTGEGIDALQRVLREWLV
jgi:GTP-binding protein